MNSKESKIYDPFNKYCNSRYDHVELTSCLNGYYTINDNFCSVVFANRGENNFSQMNYNACMDGYKKGHPSIL